MNIEHITIEVLAGFAAIVVVSLLLGALCRRFRQPAVIGQIMAGILLGAGVLGRVSEDLQEKLFPPDAVPFLGVISQFGLVLFLFSIGYELNLRLLRERRFAVPAVTTGALVVPFGSGALLGIALCWGPLAGWRPQGSNAPGALGFTLVMGVALAITAVPVLAAILAETGFHRTRPGAVAMASAGLIDLVGWLVLAGVVALNGKGSLLWRLVGVAVYLAALIFVVRPLMRWWMRRTERTGFDRLVGVVAIAMLSAWATGLLGLHVIFGALAIGLVMPRDENGQHDESIAKPVSHAGRLLLPVFFFVAALSVDIGGLRPADVALLAVTCVLAIASKIGGAAIGARMSGLPARESTLIGVLLNTRGLTELIVLSVCLQLGMINTRLYTILVLMALVTTVMTGPLARLVVRGTSLDPDRAVEEPVPATVS